MYALTKTLGTLAALGFLASAATRGWASPKASTHVPAGGAMQRPSVEGCMNTWLFNGVWRLQVLGVTKGGSFTSDGDTGYAVRVQLRNGTKKQIYVKGSGFAGQRNRNINLVMSDDTTYPVATNGSYTTAYDALISSTVPPGAAVNATFDFVVPKAALDGSATPKKLLVEVDRQAIFPDERSSVKYSTADPSFRVKLDCDKKP
jgi:hypothetical protein